MKLKITQLENAPIEKCIRLKETPFAIKTIPKAQIILINESVNIREIR